MAVLSPTRLDFTELAEAVRRNNMGLGGFKLHVKAVVGDRVRIEPTGQTFALAGPAAGQGAGASAVRGPSRQVFRVLDWADPSKTRLEPLP